MDTKGKDTKDDEEGKVVGRVSATLVTACREWPKEI